MHCLSQSPKVTILDTKTVVTILTLVMVTLWVISAVVRIWVAWPEARVLDAIMPIIIGYWFLSNSSKKNGVTA